MADLFSPLAFTRGPAMKNRFALAPLTNTQSGPDGVLSGEEFRWLTMRAQGGFGLTMTCAAHVQAVGQGFPGQLGIWDDRHIPGLSRLAAEIKRNGSLAMVQLHHAGNRSPADLIGTRPVSASDDEKTGARGLTTDEAERLIEDFIAAARRAERAGFDGVELHGAHGYIIAQFLSAELNRRTDRFGGGPGERARFLLDMIDGARAATRSDFQLGVRLSPERYGMNLMDIVALVGRLMREGKVDLVDMSLWDSFKEPNEEEHRGRSLASYFAALERGNTRLGAAGKIKSGEDARRLLDAGFDFAVIGRAAILHHDFPERVRADPHFTHIDLPVPEAYLAREGLSSAFVNYMRQWPGFVEEPATVAAE